MRKCHTFLLTFILLFTNNLNAQEKESTIIHININEGDQNKRPDESLNRIYIDFTGTGELQKSYTQGETLNANTGIGITLERYNHDPKWIKIFALQARLNVATTSDSIIGQLLNDELQNQREFGSYILNPISRKQSLYLNSNIFFNIKNGAQGEKLFRTLSGLNFRLITSNNVWKYNGKNTNLGVLYFRAGIFHEFVPKLKRLIPPENDENGGRTRYSIFAGINYSWRTIFGDITSDRNVGELTNILGSDQTAYNGWELNFGFRLNNFRAEFQMPIITPRTDSVEGLTNTQFLYSITFLGGFGLKLGGDPKPKSTKEQEGKVKTDMNGS